MEEFEEIDYYLKPTKKNHMLLGFLFLILTILGMLLGWMETEFTSIYEVLFEFMIHVQDMRGWSFFNPYSIRFLYLLIKQASQKYPSG